MPPAIALVAIAFTLGIALREVAHLSTAACAASLALASAALIFSAARRHRLFGLAVLAQALTLGLLAAALAWPRAPAGLLDGEPWDVSGRLVEPPARAFGQVHLLLALDEVARDGIAHSALGRLRIALPGDPVEPLLPGDHLRFHARLVRPHGFWEPDSPNPARRIAERGVIAVAGLVEPAALARMIDGPAGGAWPSSTGSTGSTAAGARRVAARWQRYLLGRLARHLDGERRALVESLVLGERGGISRELDDAFRKAGVTHVLSVSGLHLAIAAFLFLVGLRWLLVRWSSLARRTAVHRIAAACALPATLVYALVTGAAIATLRSLAVTWVFLVGAASGRAGSSSAAIAVAALVLLGASPLALYDPSLQLSFAAALGASLFAPRLMRMLRRGFLDEKTRAAGFARFVLGLVLTSAAAIVATAPITAWHFAQVAPVGLISNVLVVPLAELWVLPIGLGGCALAPLWDRAAGLFFHLAGLGAAAMAALARFFAHGSPDGTVPAPTTVEVLLYYAVLSALFFAFEHRTARRAALGLFAAFLLAVSARVVSPRIFPALAIHFLDVGQGDSCLVELPDGRTLLVDGGGSWSERFDPGAQILVPWLERHGTRRLDVVVLTHPHPDHANGLAAVVDRFPVGEIWTNGASSTLPGLVRLEAAAARRGLTLMRPHALQGSATVEVLHPIDRGVVRPRLHDSENDSSIVLRLQYAGRTVLLTGDIERRAEARLVEELPAAVLAADIVKAPHHGSPTSSTSPFVAATHPRLVVFSAGAENRWGFPNRRVISRWRAAGADTLRTDENGAVSVRIGRGGNLSIETARRPVPCN